jgi:hypothetical protein
MCRSTLSVGWDGQLYDCDFNQMLDLAVAPRYIRHFQLDASKSRSSLAVIVSAARPVPARAAEAPPRNKHRGHAPAAIIDRTGFTIVIGLIRATLFVIERFLPLRRTPDHSSAVWSRCSS